MKAGLDTLQRPTSSPGSALAVDFDTEFRLLEDRIVARLHPGGLGARVRHAAHLVVLACRVLAVPRP